MQEHMLAHLDRIADGDERRALMQELHAYFYRYPFSVEEIEGGFSGWAVFETGEITIAPRQLQSSCSDALNTYLHEIAHIICCDGHSVEFATLAAGMQKRFRCHDPASIKYDTHEAVARDRQSYEYQQLRLNAVRPITEPETYISTTRAVTAHRNWFERQLLPNLVALAVVSALFAGYVFWPWVKLFLQNDAAMFATGVALVGTALVYGLFS